MLLAHAICVTAQSGKVAGREELSRFEIVSLRELLDPRLIQRQRVPTVDIDQ